ncbi:Twin-arginine translocation pathway signal [Streptomyces sp. SM14]|uniref:Twin-arginine translocation pathway signal n=1 Tax=Streptomyces sp. SM14 TaxID=1736045 RepID=UPI0011B0BF0F|nr:Twin-arginine translocation pathway signal [Streptomyces sp. SM14]
MPEITALEAWRLALGWSRREAIDQVAECYRADGLHPPGLTEPMLCRWEHPKAHNAGERPGPEYTYVLARAYGTTADDLELTRRGRGLPLQSQTTVRYRRQAAPPWEEVQMTTAAGLPAVRESVHLALLADPAAGSAVLDAAQTALQHYALAYSKHPPHTLFGEVRRVRELLTAPLTAGVAADSAELYRILGWLSALLGNLAHHLDDHTGADVHLAAATHIGHRVGDARLTAWSYGARSMTARTRGQYGTALEHATAGVAAAPTPLVRAQLLGWALLPSLAAEGRAEEAEDARRRADDAFDAAEGDEPGRFGYDRAEHRLHQAEAHLALDAPRRALPLAEKSAEGCTPGTPGWAAATLLLARVEAAGNQVTDAAARALDVLDRVQPERLRSTARARLLALNTALGSSAHGGAHEFRERHRALPPLIDSHGRGLTSAR